MRFRGRRRFRAWSIRRWAAQDLDRAPQPLLARGSARRSLRTAALRLIGAGLRDRDLEIAERSQDPGSDAALGSTAADSTMTDSVVALAAASDLVLAPDSDLDLASAGVGVGVDRGVSGGLDGVGIPGGRATFTRLTRIHIHTRTPISIRPIRFTGTTQHHARIHRGRMFTATTIRRVTTIPRRIREIPTKETRILQPATSRLRRQPFCFT